MNRRSVLLLLATLVALIGTALVVVYVRSADNRAQEQFDTVEVLRATQTIEAGESIEAATSAGKIASQAVPKNQVLEGAMQSVDALKGDVAVTTIFAGEQIIPAKFGGAAQGQTLAIPEGMQAISVELTDSARVSGFVSPGSEVAIYHIEPMLDVTQQGERHHQRPRGRQHQRCAAERRRAAAAQAGAGPRCRVDLDHHDDLYQRPTAPRPPKRCRARCSPSPSTRPTPSA